MPFRITRNADIEADEDDEPTDLVHMVEEELRQRRLRESGAARISLPASQTQLHLIAHKLELTEVDIYEMPSELDFTDLFAIAGLNRPELRDPPWTADCAAGFDEDTRPFCHDSGRRRAGASSLRELRCVGGALHPRRRGRPEGAGPQNDRLSRWHDTPFIDAADPGGRGRQAGRLSGRGDGPLRRAAKPGLARRWRRPASMWSTASSA